MPSNQLLDGADVIVTLPSGNTCAATIRYGFWSPGGYAYSVRLSDGRVMVLYHADVRPA